MLLRPDTAASSCLHSHPTSTTCIHPSVFPTFQFSFPKFHAFRCRKTQERSCGQHQTHTLPSARPHPSKLHIHARFRPEINKCPPPHPASLPLPCRPHSTLRCSYSRYKARLSAFPTGSLARPCDTAIPGPTDYLTDSVHPPASGLRHGGWPPPSWGPVEQSTR